jgi:hypothetical protein
VERKDVVAHGSSAAAMKELEERRLRLCRLTPDRALASVEEAHDLLRRRGMLTRTQDSALPSFFAACHEEPYAPGGRGFAGWPKTKYTWYFQLAELEDVHELKVHNGKSILFTDQTLALVDALCRRELERRKDDVLLTHLAATGPSTLGDLQTELALSAKDLRSMRAPLERSGALVGRALRIKLRDGGHSHTSELLRYDQAYPEPRHGGGLDELIVAAVRAAVLAPERELNRWFPWRVDAETVDRLVAGGRLVRPEPDWITASPFA